MASRIGPSAMEEHLHMSFSALGIVTTVVSSIDQLGGVVCILSKK